MKKIGLTGSIGAGKSAAVKFLRARGIAVHDADAAVHEIYAQPETLAWLLENFPDAMGSGQIDKEKLAKIIFENPDALKKLENYIHPRVAAHRAEFMKSATARGEKIVVCDIPLLFETGAEHEFDEVWLLTAPDDIRMARVMSRPGMTAEKFNAINAMQMPQAEKEKLATRVIENNGTLEELHEKLTAIMAVA
jgi:dephospho-CoA kinase